MRILKPFVTLLFLLTAVTVSAQQQTESVFRFLSLNSEARTSALGGAHAAYINPGFMLLHANPALVRAGTGRNFQASYLNYIGDINYGSASYVRRFDELGDLTASVRFLNYGDLTQYDEQGTDLGNLSANDVALSFGWSAGLAENIFYGVSITGIHSSIGGFQSTGISASGGLYYQFERQETAFGIALKNAGTQLSTYNGISEPLPLNLAATAVHKPQYIPIRFHLTLQRLTDWNSKSANDEEDIAFGAELMRHVIFGTEFIFGDYVSVQLGYNHWLHQQAKTGNRLDAAGLSTGIGLQFNNFDINMARTAFSDLGNVIQLSFALSL